MTCEYVRANWAGVRPSASIRASYLTRKPAGRSRGVGSGDNAARASSRPTSKSASASPRASIARGSARRFRTFTAPGLDSITTASPSHTNHEGTRCGPPSTEVDDSQITGSVSRNRCTRAAARAFVSMPGASSPRGSIAADAGRVPAWTSDEGVQPLLVNEACRLPARAAGR
jgi:hypothetical protein